MSGLLTYEYNCRIFIFFAILILVVFMQAPTISLFIKLDFLFAQAL